MQKAQERGRGRSRHDTREIHRPQNDRGRYETGQKGSGTECRCYQATGRNTSAGISWRGRKESAEGSGKEAGPALNPLRDPRLSSP